MGSCVVCGAPALGTISHRQVVTVVGTAVVFDDSVELCYEHGAMVLSAMSAGYVLPKAIDLVMQYEDERMMAELSAMLDDAGFGS